MKKLITFISIGLILQSCGKNPEADFSWSPHSPKAGQEMQFTNHSRDASRYSWNFGDMSIGNETNPKHIYEKEGEYIVDLSAYSGIKSDIKTVRIIVLP